MPKQPRKPTRRELDPKGKDSIWAFAYEDHHSDGFESVLDAMEDLVELMADLVDKPNPATPQTEPGDAEHLQTP